MYMEIEERNLTFANALEALKVIVTRPKVSLEIFKERIETCDSCNRLKQTPQGQTYCGVCKCNITKNQKDILNLAAYKEKLPKHGCLHPFRGLRNPTTNRTFGWKR